MRDYPELYRYIALREADKALDSAGDQISGHHEAANVVWSLAARSRAKWKELAGVGNPADYDVLMAACRPVEPSDEEKALIRTLPPEIPYPPIYPGSTIRQCQGCGRDVYVGPRTQEQMQKHKVALYCFFDAAKMQRVSELLGNEVAVHSLGNPFTPKGGRNAP